jgi:YebC/PmpR family DNA-binding regulatory protein
LPKLAGHNKWSKVKHRKAVVDKRRSKAWSMCSRAIISAARQGGPDPNFNFLLRAAIEEARYHNVPNENIDRAIKRGAGATAGDNYEHVRYEGYGPGGVAVVADALTDNRTRTAANVRNIFSDHGGKLGTTGSVAHLFEARGRIEIIGSPTIEEPLLEAALNAGADDCVRGEDDERGRPTWAVLCSPTEYAQVREAMRSFVESFIAVHAERSRGGKDDAPQVITGESGIELFPVMTVGVSRDAARTLMELLDALEDDEDVRKVWSNAEMPDTAQIPEDA